MKLFAPSSQARGGVLLEVLMALALILGASSVITGGLQSAVDSVERMRNSVHGLNLAVSVLSQIQMGILVAEQVENESFEAPFEEWSYDIETEEVESDTISLEGGSRSVPQMVKVEVVVHRPGGQVIKRMSQFVFVESEE